jgi:hypothetical protein
MNMAKKTASKSKPAKKAKSLTADEHRDRAAHYDLQADLARANRDKHMALARAKTPRDPKKPMGYPY